MKEGRTRGEGRKKEGERKRWRKGEMDKMRKGEEERGTNRQTYSHTDRLSVYPPLPLWDLLYISYSCVPVVASFLGDSDASSQIFPKTAAL